MGGTSEPSAASAASARARRRPRARRLQRRRGRRARARRTGAACPRGTLLGQAGQERSARRVGHVRREPEMREVDRASEDRLDPLALVDRLDELGRAQLGDPAVVPLPERRCGGSASCDVLLDAWVVTALVQVGEVPRDVLCTRQLCGRHVAGRYLREGSSRSPIRATISSSEWFRCWRKTRVTPSALSSAMRSTTSSTLPASQRSRRSREHRPRDPRRLRGSPGSADAFDGLRRDPHRGSTPS